MLTPEGARATPLRLSTQVDAAFLEGARQELETVLRARLAALHARRALALRPRWMRHGTSFAKWPILRVVGSRAWAIGLSLLSLAGLYLAVGAPADESFLASRQADVAFFTTGLLVAWFPHRRWAAWVDRYTARRPRSRIVAPVARMQVRTLLRHAQQAAPFEAEYLVDGSRAVYARVAGERRTVVWERALAGWRHTGDHFTLLFKTEAAGAPCVLILHAPCPAFEAHLEAVGIQACAPAGDV